MNKFLAVAGRILLGQIFLVQIIILLNSFMSNPAGYEQYQMGIASQGLPGIFAPLIILIQVLGGLALLVGYKTKFVALAMSVYVVFLTFFILPPLQYFAIVGGLLLLAANPSTAYSVDNLKK